MFACQVYICIPIHKICYLLFIEFFEKKERSMHIPVNEKSKTQPDTPKSQVNLKISSEKV